MLKTRDHVVHWSATKYITATKYIISLNTSLEKSYSFFRFKTSWSYAIGQSKGRFV